MSKIDSYQGARILKDVTLPEGSRRSAILDNIKVLDYFSVLEGHHFLLNTALVSSTPLLLKRLMK